MLLLSVDAIQLNTSNIKMPALSPNPLEGSLLPTLDQNDLADLIAIMRIQEETTYMVHDYLADKEELRKLSAKPVDEDCRTKMCEWCYHVIDYCKFRRETVGIGMSFLDRYLCTRKGKDTLGNRKEYQLAAMTTLYIAIKMHEPMEIETSLLADLSHGMYDEMEFVTMEQTILQTLKFRVNGPTPLSFVQHFMALTPKGIHYRVSQLLMDFARFQTELVISQQKFVAIRPSEIGFAAILNAIEGIGENLVSRRDQAAFIRNIEDFSEIAKEDVEKTQLKLSLLLITLIEDETEEVLKVAAALKEEDEFQGVVNGVSPGKSPSKNLGNFFRRGSKD